MGLQYIIIVNSHAFAILTNVGFLKQGKVASISLISGNSDDIHNRLLQKVASIRSFTAFWEFPFSVASESLLTSLS